MKNRISFGTAQFSKVGEHITKGNLASEELFIIFMFYEDSLFSVGRFSGFLV